MENIILNKEQLSVLEKNLKHFSIEKSFIARVLKPRKIYLPKDKSSAKSYDEARAVWCLSAQGSKDERVALIAMIDFAFKQEKSTEALLLDACSLALRSIDEVGKMLVIRAMAQVVIKESLVCTEV